MKRSFLKRGTIGGARLQEIRQIPVNFRASSSHYRTWFYMKWLKFNSNNNNTTQHSKNTNI